MDELLRAYSQEGDEQAFEELVNRNVNLVYATALRRVSGDIHKAQDVAQQVFTDLARKARSLPPGVRLSGWLHRHTCFMASNLLRSEQRRLNREKVALDMYSNSSEDAWTQLAPVVDEAIDQLDATDRDAILLRFFEQSDLRTIGEALGINEDAAQKRVSRAVDKLRVLLERQGVVLTAVALIALLSTQALASPPLGLATGLARAALASAKSGGTATILVKLLHIGKVKIALGTAMVAILFLPLFWLQQVQNKAAVPLVTNIASTNNISTANEHDQNLAKGGTPLTNSSTSNILHLKLIAEDSGKIIPRFSVECLGWTDRKSFTNQLVSAPQGECDIDVPLNTVRLMLFARSEGFADSKLSWYPERGFKVPDHYTLKMVRSVQIGGVVVDPDGNPVADAVIGLSSSFKARGRSPSSSNRAG